MNDERISAYKKVTGYQGQDDVIKTNCPMCEIHKIKETQEIKDQWQ